MIREDLYLILIRWLEKVVGYDELINIDSKLVDQFIRKILDAIENNLPKEKEIKEKKVYDITWINGYNRAIQNMKIELLQ